MSIRSRLRLDPPSSTTRDSAIGPYWRKYIESLYQRVGEGPLMIRAHRKQDLLAGGPDNLQADKWGDAETFSSIVLVVDGGSVYPAYSDGSNWIRVSNNNQVT